MASRKLVPWCVVWSFSHLSLLFISIKLPCMEWSCNVWAGAPSWYLELLYKLQKMTRRTVGPSLAAYLEPLGWNVASLSLFCRYYFGRCSSELAQFHVLILEGVLLIILIDCLFFVLLFVDVTRMSMSTVSSLAQLDTGILCL